MSLFPVLHKRRVHYVFMVSCDSALFSAGRGLPHKWTLFSAATLCTCGTCLSSSSSILIPIFGWEQSVNYRLIILPLSSDWKHEGVQSPPPPRHWPLDHLFSAAWLHPSSPSLLGLDQASCGTKDTIVFHYMRPLCKNQDEWGNHPTTQLIPHCTFLLDLWLWNGGT